MQTRTYYAVVDPDKKTHPIRDLIEAAIETTRERHPQAAPDVLMLNPCHLETLGTVVHAGGQTWMASYNRLIGPREVRVGPLD